MFSWSKVTTFIQYPVSEYFVQYKYWFVVQPQRFSPYNLNYFLAAFFHKSITWFNWDKMQSTRAFFLNKSMNFIEPVLLLDNVRSIPVEYFQLYFATHSAPKWILFFRSSIVKWFSATINWHLVQIWAPRSWSYAKRTIELL